MQCVRTHNNIGQITELHNAGEGFVEKPSRLPAGNKEGYSYSQKEHSRPFHDRPSHIAAIVFCCLEI